VQVKEIIPRPRQISYEMTRRSDAKRWLSAVRAVIEGQAPPPDAGMAPALWLECMARPRINDPHSASASVMINADPATVWEAVHSPETLRGLGPPHPVYSGYVPGTRRGQAGEMQYFIARRSDGQLTGNVVVVTETSGQRSTRTHTLGGTGEQYYLLTPESESGPTRLDLTCRWPAPKRTNDGEAVRSKITDALQEAASAYKSVIEAAG
jgi:hypothetical protein